MDLGGSLWRMVKGAGMWLYFRLRVSVYWLGKLSGRSAIRFRLWLLKGRRRKSLAKLGSQVYELHQERKMEWPGSSGVQETLQILEGTEQKRLNLQVGMEQLDDQYRKNVQRLRSMSAQQAEEGGEAAEAEAEQ